MSWLASLPLLTSLLTLQYRLTSAQNVNCTWQEAAVPVASVSCEQHLLTVIYGGREVRCDQAFSANDALLLTPILHWGPAATGSIYLVLMVDPDAPTPCRPDSHYILHWVAYLRGPDLEVIHEFVSYRGPHPPVGSAPHRYQFLLFPWVPPPGLNNPDLLGHFDGQRARFDLGRFKEVNQLGEPAASFQLQCQRFSAR